METTPLPLTGLNVLDLTRVLAGPYCTQMLADLGATVWKIESPRGDDTRQWGPPFVKGESGYFLSANRGKHSVVINLKEAQGQALVRQLAQRADIFIENFKTGDLKRYGLDYATLQPLNPRLIYASITGFGQSGPRAKEPGYDVTIQGLSSIMALTGEAEGAPVKVGVAWIDVLTGVHTAVALLAALREREQSGQGQQIDMALFDVALASLVNQAQSTLLTGVAPPRMGSAHPQLVPYQAFMASDGASFMVAVGNDGQFARLCEVLGHPEWATHPDFCTNPQRVIHRHILIPQLQRCFLEKERATWLRCLLASQVPVTPVNDTAEALQDPQALARTAIWTLPHQMLAEVALVASPFQHLSRTPAAPQIGPPLLGQHTYEVLQQTLELTPKELQDLTAQGVLRTSAE